MRHRWFRPGAVVALSCCAVALLMGVMQDAMIYFPARQSESDQVRHAAAVGLSPWRDTKGEIVGWRRPNPRATARLIVLHGNAGCALDRVSYADAFGALGWEVSIFEYPGYGARPGQPGKAAFFAAARAAITEAIVTDSRPLVLLGESIGTGTVCAILAEDAGSEAAERPSLPRAEGSGQPALQADAGAPAGAMLAGAALVVPFARLIEVAWSHYGPLALLLRDRFDNIATLRSCRVPVAFVVAGEDEVVGAQQGRKLHASFTGPKLLIDLPGATHNGFTVGSDSEWVRAVDAFLRRHPSFHRSTP